VEPPAKGKGSYDRGRQDRTVRREVDEDLGE
jgi:stalled ribosome alternative rescue factor ArfA